MNKKVTILLLVVMALLLMVVPALAEEEDPTPPATFPYTQLGVMPVADPDWTTGDAGQECVVNLGFDFGVKIDNWSGSVVGPYTGTYDDQGSPIFDDDFLNTITISNNDGTYFDWESDPFALGAVVVKGGSGTNVFYYDTLGLADGANDDYIGGPAFADSGLYAPINPNNNKPAEISHVSFCWDKVDEKCEYEYYPETAWAAGTRFDPKRGWATYSTYVPYGTVDIYAGQNMLAGTVTFTPLVADGSSVRIQIDLKNGFVFYYDLNNDLEDNNIKIQGFADAPGKRDANPGLYDNKYFAPVGSTSYAVVVPGANFYGIHLDLALEVATCTPVVEEPTFEALPVLFEASGPTMGRPVYGK